MCDMCGDLRLAVLIAPRYGGTVRRFETVRAGLEFGVLAVETGAVVFTTCVFEGRRKTG